MKRLKTFIPAVVALVSATFTSCDNDCDDNYYYGYPNTQYAIVTVKNTTNESSEYKWYMQLDDSTRLYPTNDIEPPYPNKDEVRAYVVCKISEPREYGSRDFEATVLNVDSILTKQLVANLSTTEDNDKAYGNDPIEIVNSWDTVAEDGYMTIHFRTNMNQGYVHRVNLMRVEDTEGVATYEFRHDANGDLGGRTNDGIVAFRLDDKVNEGNEKTEILLRWKSFTGIKSVKFKYIPRKD